MGGASAGPVGTCVAITADGRDAAASTVVIGPVQDSMLAQLPGADGRPQGTSSAGAPHSTHPLPVAARVSPMAMPAMIICAFDRLLASS